MHGGRGELGVQLGRTLAPFAAEGLLCDSSCVRRLQFACELDAALQLQKHPGIIHFSLHVVPATTCHDMQVRKLCRAKAGVKEFAEVPE